MSAHKKERTVELEKGADGRNDWVSAGFFTDKIEERINANLEALHAQISSLTEMMEKLIQRRSAREFRTASTRKT